MITKGLSKEQALKNIELFKNSINFNNKLNKFVRDYMREKGLDRNAFNGYHDQATPEMIEIMNDFVSKEEWMPNTLKQRYIEDTNHIFGQVYSIAVNTYILKDLHECEHYLETLEHAEQNSEEENSLFRTERLIDESRMNLYFDGKPEQDVISALKHNGFKWSPKRECWTRQLTENAERSLKRLKETLKDKITENSIKSLEQNEGSASSNKSEKKEELKMNNENAGYKIISRIKLSDMNNIVVGYGEGKPSPYVTWDEYILDDKVMYGTGNYFTELLDASKNQLERAGLYQNGKEFDRYMELTENEKNNLFHYICYKTVQEQLNTTDRKILKDVGDLAYNTWLNCNYDELSIDDCAYKLSIAINNGNIDYEKAKNISPTDLAERIIDDNWYISNEKEREL